MYNAHFIIENYEKTLILDQEIHKNHIIIKMLTLLETLNILGTSYSDNMNIFLTWYKNTCNVNLDSKVICT